MPADGILGDGVKVAYSTTSPVSWTEITQLLDMPKPPGPVADKLENTTHGTDGYHTYGYGLNDVPDWEATFLFDADNAAHMALMSAKVNKTTLWFRVEVPTNAAKTTFIAWEWQGIVTTADPDTPLPDWQKLNVVVAYAGGFSFYPTAGATQIS